VWFQRRCIRFLQKHAGEFDKERKRPRLFVYSYAGLQLLQFAKSRGWQTVMSQIDGGELEEQIVETEHWQRPGISSEWCPAPRQYWQSWRSECELADRILVNSEWSERLVRDAGVPAEKVRVIPVAYDAESRAREFNRTYPAEFTESRPLRALFLGSFVLRKGAAAVLEAMRLLKNEVVEFWIVGELGVDVPAELRTAPRVKWIGPVSRSTTTEYYRAADVFLFPTVSDGFGMTQVEARAWKLPVIASPCCAAVIKHNVNGLVIQELSGQSLADAIRSFIAQPTRLLRLAVGQPGEYSFYSSDTVRNKLLAGPDPIRWTAWLRCLSFRSSLFFT
jgi:glycosyltransferase involved in cell wall biosynthesis